MLMPLEGDSTWVSHREILDDVVGIWDSFLDVLRNKQKHASSAVAQVVLAATMDIAYVPHLLGDNAISHKQNRNISWYKDECHLGIAYVLQLQRLQYNANSTDHDIEDMIQTRNSFIDSIDGVMKRQELNEYLFSLNNRLSINLAGTQLFIPGVLLQIPAVAKAIEKDGRIDCLGRPVSHILHDNKVNKKLRFDPHGNRHDILGRSSLHIASTLGADEQHDLDLLLLPKSAWPDHESLGLDALYVAAMHGNTNIFRIAATSGYNVVRPFDMYYSAHAQRTYLHLAACLGHLELVRYLLALYAAPKLPRFMGLVVYCDQGGDTALHLAARNGHAEVVKAILRHTDWSQMKGACYHHTPFWAATTGRHLNIMKLLSPVSNVDEDEGGTLTPLAEAARLGFLEGVEYLLKLDGVDENSLNKCWDDMSRSTVLKTPLDLAIEGKHNECVELLKKHGALTAPRPLAGSDDGINPPAKGLQIGHIPAATNFTGEIT
jgi:ankyrin repeat protein